MKKYKRITVKIGSNVLTRSDGLLRQEEITTYKWLIHGNGQIRS